MYIVQALFVQLVHSTFGIANTLLFDSDLRITKPVTELQGNIAIPDAIKKLPNAVGFGNTYSFHHAMAIDASGELQKYFSDCW